MGGRSTAKDWGCLLYTSGLGGELHIGIVPQLLVQIDNVQDIEQLTLILMQTLDLDIEDGVSVQKDAGFTGQIGGKTALVLLLDALQLLEHRSVVFVLLQALDGLGVEEVFVSAGTCLLYTSRCV